MGAADEWQKRPVGYVSIVSLSSTVPSESTDTSTSTRPKFGLTSKQHSQQRAADFGRHRSTAACVISLAGVDKSFNDDDEYMEEEELNSELEDSDVEFNLKNKQQKFNPNMIRNKLINIFKRKPNQSSNTSSRTANAAANSAANSSHQHDQFIVDHHSDFEEDPPSDISDSTIPVDQWSIESVPKPGFTPVEHLQVLKFVSVHFDQRRRWTVTRSLRSLKTIRTRRESQPIHSIAMIVRW